MLSDEDFYFVINKTNLVSIDLMINYQGKYLLGKRKNNPAKDYFFTIGGCIDKSESFDDAIKRLSQRELKIKLTLDDLKFNKVTQHWYDNNYKDDKFGTRYVNISYTKTLTNEEYNNLDISDQHNEIIWLTKEELLSNENVHEMCKTLFD